MSRFARLPAGTGADAPRLELAAALAAARQAEARLRAAIDVLPEGVVFLDEDDRYVLWNAQYAEIYAKSADLLQPGAKLADTLRIGVARGDYPEAAGREAEWLAERLARLDNPGAPHEQRLANGRRILIEERKTADGGTIGLRVDITEMREREETLSAIFEANPVPLLLYDPESEQIRAGNEAACGHFGYTARDFAAMPADRLFEADEWAEAQPALRRDSSEKDRFWRQRAADGTRLDSVLFTRQIRIRGRDGIVISVFDVTEQRQIEARMAYLARHDELTGLNNRAHCREQLHDLVGGASEGGRMPSSVTVALVDLDHFKVVNDTYGHQVGDMLLAEAARRMATELPRAATLSRIGGDEFALVFRKSSATTVEMVSKGIIAALSEPFFVGDHRLHIGATVGAATAPFDCDDPETLMRYADLALYAAKAERRGSFRRFDIAMDAAAQARSRLEADFRDAVREGALEVHYQPMINLMSGETEGYEALLRWNHPVRGAISPEVFVPLAEEMGLIEVLGAQVLQRACRDAMGWPETMVLSVNVSPLQFRNGGLLNTVLQALSASRLPANRLELEITEAVLMDRSTRTEATIRSLRALGVGLSMDDFGTGYSSLSYLLSYPFTKIKIDRSFVLSLGAEENSRAVVRAVVGLGKSLGMTVTAEGIEDETVRDYLREVGCFQGQGYLFGKARPDAELGHGTVDREDARDVA
ncbi:MAG: EAL domain-containing protein [Sphingomonadales bacterium]|nr:EAL domain-containing protein [Sphingomonadales bacterium]